MKTNSFEAKVARYIKEHSMLERGCSVVVGVSGGADSVCLFFMLIKLQKEYGLKLKVIHVMHGIRGSEACLDMEFTKSLCDEYGVPFKCVKKDVPSLASQMGMSVEEAGRYVRYKAFEEEETDRTAVAHNLNDLAETVLFNLFRGSSIQGLTGISPVNGKIIRPLLCVTREEIEEYLNEKGIKWCTDRTNADNTYSRNRIRNELLKEAVKINPSAIEHIARSAEELRLAEESLKIQTDSAFLRYAFEEEGRINIDINAKNELPQLILSRMVYKSLYTLSGRKKDITSKHVEDVVKLFNRQSGKSVDLIYGIRAKRDFGRIVILKKKTGEKTEFSQIGLSRLLEKGMISLEDGRIISAELIEGDFEEFTKVSYTDMLDYDKIDNDAVIRVRQKDDRISIKNGHKKVKELLTESKVPVEERDNILLLASNNDVYWIEGLRRGFDCRVTEETKTVLHISIKEIYGK